MKGSEWFHGDTYLFVYDLQANVLLNPAFPAREGTNVKGQKDAKGKLFHHAIIHAAETEGSGWVDYMFPKPGQSQPSQKWAYVKAVKIDGVPGLVASGLKPLPSTQKSRKSDPYLLKRVPSRLVERLNTRSEFLIASYYPLRETLVAQTGNTAPERRAFLEYFHTKSG